VTTEAEQQEQRAREIADITRRHLTALNTGGVTASFALASALGSNGVHPRWVVVPALLFVAGLVITTLSYYLAKDKALTRRDAAQAGAPAPNFTESLWRNFTWD
jgi:hypothetical protein